ncbi:MAG: hypothetical protein KAI74_04510 [Kiritimatiellae bacterium]|nr:hypothetical protein [Kiritimatiellia bacterium]
MTITKKHTSPYRIYIDFDDVLCETARLLLEVSNNEFGRTLLFENIHTFNIGEAFDLTEQEVEHVLAIMHKPENLLAIAPIALATETINHWAEQGYEIDIVTGRPPFSEDASRDWLEKHNIQYSDLIFVNKYSNTKNGNGFRHHDDAISLKDLTTLHYDLAIDDSSFMLQFLFNEMEMDIAIFHRPWNAKLKLPTNTHHTRKIKRCQSWQELKDTFTPEKRL